MVERQRVYRGIDAPPLARSAVPDLCEVQRLYAQPVAAEHHPPRVPLDDDEGEHALETVDESRPPRWYAFRRTSVSEVEKKR